jgi:hypothetical protein
MKNYQIVPFRTNDYLIHLTDFEEAIHNSKLHYSLRHLTFDDDISSENILESLQKSLQICQLAGIESKHHFKKIYVYDSDLKTLQIDWKMSKVGFNLMVMQFPSLNQKKAIWLWELASL